jgi:hypothetical protein
MKLRRPVTDSSDRVPTDFRTASCTGKRKTRRRTNINLWILQIRGRATYNRCYAIGRPKNKT